MFAAVAALAMTLSACGGGGDGGAGDTSGVGGTTKVTKEQWLAVPVGATKEQVLDRFGEPQYETEYAGLTDSVSYATPSVDITATFSFDADTEKLKSKNWSETTGSEVKINAALFGRVSNGMTEQQVEKILGVPFQREDEVSTFTVGRFGKAAIGTLQHCIWYGWARSPYAATVCFDRAGKVEKKTHATAP